MLIIYRIFVFLLYHLTLPYTYLACLFGSVKWRQRLGFINPLIKNDREKIIWLHASSMGEVKVLAVLKEQIEKLDETVSVYITVVTESGYKSALSIMPDSSQIAYLPLDYYSPIKRFLDYIKPQAAVFIETEIWPNLIKQLSHRNIPLFLANGRLSEKSFRWYKLLRKSLGKLLESYRFLMVQTETDKKRYLGIGADEKRIEVIGNLKFDAPVKILSDEKKALLKKSLPFPGRSRIFIAGSTRKDEHEIIFRVYGKLSSQYPDLKLILVPRHLDKIENIKRLAAKYEISFCLYTDMGRSANTISALIINEMGILNNLYAISDIAFVGGTLVNIGGHNILEPVWAGVPVLYGPSDFNVKSSSEYIIENDFGDIVIDENDLREKLMRFFSGELVFRTRDKMSSEISRANKTAQIILKSLH